MNVYDVVSKLYQSQYTHTEFNELREMFITGQRAALSMHLTKPTGEGVYNITDISQLPWAPVGNVISVPDGVVIAPACNIDMGGLRLEAEGVLVISGSNAETAELSSTGLPSGEALITGTNTLNLRNITLAPPVDCYGVDLDGAANPGAAADWFGVNFKTGIPFIVSNLGNFVGQLMAILSAQDGFKFSGTFDTVRAESSLITADGSGKVAIDFDAGTVINRRILFNGCPIVATNGATGISLPLSATVPNDRYILLFCDFAGNGTMLSGYQSDSITARHFQCRGIENTCRVGGFSMEGNATETTITDPNTYYKVAGTTVAALLESGFTHTNNRSTCNSAVSKVYHLDFSVTFDGIAGSVYAFKVYKNGVAATVAVKSTANAGGRAENVSGSGAVRMVSTTISSDYVEIWVAGIGHSNNVTVEDMSLGLTEAA